MRARALIPELQVTDLAGSLAFYTGVLGFRVAYAREEERFAMLEREDAALMLEETAGPGRRITARPLERPFGRGINFQILVSDADALAAAVQAAGHPLLIALEERSYRVGDGQVVQRQFVVADPDGYLLRFACVRSAAPHAEPEPEPEPDPEPEPASDPNAGLGSAPGSDPPHAAAPHSKARRR